MFTAYTAIISILIFFFASLHIRAEYTHSLVKIYLFKSASTSLILLLAYFSADLDKNYQFFILAGLLFSLMGDIFLISSTRFIPGLISFLIAHLFYIAAFVNVQTIDSILNIYTLIPFIVFALLVLNLIYSGLGNLKIPVIIYLLVIVVMGWQALNYHFIEQSLFSLFAVIGAVFFMFSDSLIALDKFRCPLKHARLSIMSTYYFGQWLIALSILGLI